MIAWVRALSRRLSRARRRARARSAERCRRRPASRPCRRSALTVATNVSDGTTTSSPGPRPAAAQMRCSAAVPLATASGVARAGVRGEVPLERLRLGAHAEPAGAVDVGHDRDVLLGHDDVGERDPPPGHGPTVPGLPGPARRMRCSRRWSPSQAGPSSSPAPAGSSAATWWSGSSATARACARCADTTRATSAARSTGSTPTVTADVEVVARRAARRRVGGRGRRGRRGRAAPRRADRHPVLLHQPSRLPRGQRARDAQRGPGGAARTTCSASCTPRPARSTGARRPSRSPRSIRSSRSRPTRPARSGPTRSWRASTARSGCRCACCARSTPTGRASRRAAVIPTIISQALAGSTMRLGSLTPRRDLTYVEDTVAGFVAAACADDATGRTVQLGTNTDISVDELVTVVGELLGRELAVEMDRERIRPDGSEVERLRVAGPSSPRELLGWEAAVGPPRRASPGRSSGSSATLTALPRGPLRHLRCALPRVCRSLGRESGTVERAEAARGPGRRRQLPAAGAQALDRRRRRAPRPGPPVAAVPRCSPRSSVLDSPGPVLYRANRVGYRGRPLRMLKFRKMRGGDRAAADPRRRHAPDARGRVARPHQARRAAPALARAARRDEPRRPASRGAGVRRPLPGRVRHDPAASAPGSPATRSSPSPTRGRSSSRTIPSATTSRRCCRRRSRSTACTPAASASGATPRILVATLVTLVLRQPVAVDRASGALTQRDR